MIFLEGNIIMGNYGLVAALLFISTGLAEAAPAQPALANLWFARCR